SEESHQIGNWARKEMKLRMKSPLGGIHLRRIARPKDLVRNVENALRRTLADWLGTTPGLNVTPAELRASETQRLATQQRDGFGFDFANFPRRDLRILEFVLVAMSKNHV